MPRFMRPNDERQWEVVERLVEDAARLVDAPTPMWPGADRVRGDMTDLRQDIDRARLEGLIR